MLTFIWRVSNLILSQRTWWNVPVLECLRCVPQGVPQMLAWPCGGVNHFDWQPWVTLCLGRWAGPVGLCDLLPHDHVEARARLVSENEAGIVIIPIRVDEESSTEVNWIELIKTFKEIRKKVRIYVIICILNWLAIHVFFLISFF